MADDGYEMMGPPGVEAKPEAPPPPPAAPAKATAAAIPEFPVSASGPDKPSATASASSASFVSTATASASVASTASSIPQFPSTVLTSSAVDSDEASTESLYDALTYSDSDEKKPRKPLYDMVDGWFESDDDDEEEKEKKGTPDVDDEKEKKEKMLKPYVDDEDPNDYDVINFILLVFFLIFILSVSIPVLLAASGVWHVDLIMEHLKYGM
ncbi:hypothetical protein CRE_18265 [Caenorhabditis remanei]|uniref:Uncharacterized protein n=1 Tax=Caenorhabditis remanei TaxID=31234 RepID=E3NHI7_CAERE|nr:hypothetical protein CRE_18265 [Caenorhabditis remanei]